MALLLSHMEVKMNFFEFQDVQGVQELGKFIHVADSTGNLWFAGKPIVEILQNSSVNTDRVINKIDACYRKKLEDIIIDFETFDKLPIYLKEKSVMINVEGIKLLIDTNNIATETKKIWIHQKINNIVNCGEFEAETQNMDCSIVPANEINLEQNITSVDSLIQIKNFKYGEETVTFRYINSIDSVWFVGKDIANMLGYSDTRKAIQDHVSDYNIQTFGDLPKSLGVDPFLFLHNQTKLINEAGFYQLIIKSKMPKAKEFQTWVTSDVLPKCNVLDKLNKTYTSIVKHMNGNTNKLQITDFQFGSETITFRFINTTDGVWLVGKDVANMLGYSDTKKAIQDHVSDYNITIFGDWVHLPDYDYRTSLQNHTKLINEAGLYELIMGSKMLKAKEFKKWVTCEVLPSIRKTGHYSIQQASITDAENLNTINKVIEGSNATWYEEKIKMLEELREKDNERQQHQNEMLEELREKDNERQQHQNEIEKYRKREYQLKEKMLKIKNNTIKHFAIDQNTKLNLCKEMFVTHASEVPKEIGAYPVLEVYIIPRDGLPDEYNHLYGYTCSRVQKKQCGKKAKLNEYEQIYITESPNAINAWRCVKDRLKILNETILNHNKRTFNKDNWLQKITCIYKGNTIYCSLNKNEMLDLLKKRSYGFKDEQSKLTRILAPSTITSNFVDDEEEMEGETDDEDREAREAMIEDGIRYYNEQKKLMPK